MHRRIIFLCVAYALILVPHFATAAALSVVPDVSTVTVGDTFGATVYLDAAGGNVNASDGELSFSSDIVRAQSVSIGNSIFTMWAQEPSIDAANGTVSWSGGTSAGFSGSRGRVFRILFLAKKVGVTPLLLPGASVYANDGFGTSVGTAPGTSSVTVVEATPKSNQPSKPSLPSTLGDTRIVITSPTHPSQTEWYATSTAIMVLGVPAGIDALRTIVSPYLEEAPTTPYAPPITKKTLTALAEGVQFFNVRGHAADGWGPVASYRLQIDTVPPVLSAPLVFYDATSTMLRLSVSATDATSGIRDFALLIDGATTTTFTQTDVASGSYQIPGKLTAGSHTVQIRVFDRAGNRTDSQILTFTAAPSTGNSLLLSWFMSLTAFDWILFLIFLIALVSIGINIFLWMRLQMHKRHYGQSIDMSRVRILTLDKLTSLKKEVSREVAVLDHVRERRDITAEESEDVKEMHQRLSDLDGEVGKQIEVFTNIKPHVSQ